MLCAAGAELEVGRCGVRCDGAGVAVRPGAVGGWGVMAGIRWVGGVGGVGGAKAEQITARRRERLEPPSLQVSFGPLRSSSSPSRPPPSAPQHTWAELGGRTRPFPLPRCA